MHLYFGLVPQVRSNIIVSKEAIIRPIYIASRRDVDMNYNYMICTLSQVVYLEKS